MSNPLKPDERETIERRVAALIAEHVVIGYALCPGDWPDGHAMVEDGGDIYPQNPGGLMWRPIKGEKK